jgi:hypothetical protein
MNGPLEVTGVREALAELRRLDETLYKQALKDIRTSAKPLADAISGGLPVGPPLSGFNHSGRTGWNIRGVRTVRVKLRGRKDRKANRWPLVRVQVASAPASIYDIAGRGSSNQLATALGGTASRVVWPTAERMLPEVTANVRASLERAAAQVNQRIAAR